MDQTSGRNTFGFLSATAAITIVAMILFGLAWWLVKSAFGQVAGSEQAIILAAIVAWGSSLLGLLPVAMVDTVIETAREREAVEDVIKAELERNPQSPGRYYPFNDETWKLYEEYKRRGDA